MPAPSHADKVNQRKSYTTINPDEKSRVSHDCRKPDCDSCQVHRQRLPEADPPYTTLGQLRMSQANYIFLIELVMFFVSLLASLLSFSRLDVYPEKEIHQMVVLFAYIYYMKRSTIGGAAEILFAGHFTWCIAFAWKCGLLYTFVTACFQVVSTGMRIYTWFDVGVYIGLSAVAALFSTEFPTIFFLGIYTFIAIYYFLCSFMDEWHAEDTIIAYFLIYPPLEYTINRDSSYCVPVLGTIVLTIFLVAKKRRQRGRHM